MRTLVFLRSALLSVVFSLTPGASAAAKVNPVVEVAQEQDQWCWAGVTRTALLYLGVDEKQCEIAEWTRLNNTAYDISFGFRNCCTSPSSCNEWNYFWDSGAGIDELVKHFGSVTTTRYDLPGGALTLPQVTATIDAGKIFVFRWARSNGGGHFLVGHGHDGTLMHYMDPWPGEGLKVAEHAWVKAGADHSWSSSLVVNGQPATPPPPDPPPDPPPAQTPCSGKPDGTGCDDGDLCTSGDGCHGGLCRGTARTCAATDACHEAGVCDASTGTCSSPAAPDGTQCAGGACSAGVCRATGPAPDPNSATTQHPQLTVSCSTAGTAGLAWPFAAVGLLPLRRRRRA